jgi:CXXX repeat modification system protein
LTPPRRRERSENVTSSKKPENGHAGNRPEDPGRKRVGQVSSDEREEIKSLFERKSALVELFKTLADTDQVNSAAYEKLVTDLGKVTTRFDQWWAAMRHKYRWESSPDGRWEIDFDDGVIYLVTEE